MKNYFQEFEVNAGAEVGKGTTLDRRSDRTFDAGKDFIPLSFSAEGKFSGPVVFAGYGVSSTEHDYDDYKDLDVKDKLVMVMRFEPHDEKGKSQFTGDDWSTDAHLATKAQQALDHGRGGRAAGHPRIITRMRASCRFARARASSAKIRWCRSRRPSAMSCSSAAALPI
jgi:hypothetical protein